MPTWKRWRKFFYIYVLLKLSTFSKICKPAWQALSATNCMKYQNQIQQKFITSRFYDTAAIGFYNFTEKRKQPTHNMNDIERKVSFYKWCEISYIQKNKPDSFSCPVCSKSVNVYSLIDNSMSFSSRTMRCTFTLSPFT